MIFNLNFTFITAVFISLIGLATVGQAKDCVTSVDGTVLFQSGGISHVGVRVVDYLAVIGNRDLYNSKGKQLSTFAAIIQQDRANYHKSNSADKIDNTRDQGDHYFTTLERRQILSNAPYYYDCYMNKTDIAALHKDVLSSKSVFIWVVLFRQPDGNLAVYSTPVG